jgi:transcriptional regulator with XRE-family HTH domain
MRRRNVIGRIVSRLRSERNWTQEILAARLQCEGADISRDMIAKIELGRTKISDECIIGLQKVFRIQIVRLFPPNIQDLDKKFAGYAAAKSSKARPRHAQG